jgi:hypothetical protein
MIFFFLKNNLIGLNYFFKMQNFAEKTNQFLRVSNEWIKLVHEKKLFGDVYSELMELKTNKINIKSNIADEYLRNICNDNIYTPLKSIIRSKDVYFFYIILY